MAFVDRAISIETFLWQLRGCLEGQDNEGAVILFDSCLRRALERKFADESVPEQNWSEPVRAHDIRIMYPLAAGRMQEAIEARCSLNPNVYQDAQLVLNTFCTAFNELFKCSGEHELEVIQITKSTETADAAYVEASAPG